MKSCQNFRLVGDKQPWCERDLMGAVNPREKRLMTALRKTSSPLGKAVYISDNPIDLLIGELEIWHILMRGGDPA
jgi:hypothetical protein